MNPLQEVIHRRMRELGIDSYSALGRRARLPRATVHALATIENRSSLPRRETLEHLAPALGVTVDELMDKAYQSLGPQVRRGDRMVPVVGDIEGMSDLDLIRLQEAINQEQRRRHERSHE